jgi:hypothetical protein
MKLLKRPNSRATSKFSMVSHCNSGFPISVKRIAGLAAFDVIENLA